ncbi:TRAP transporter large permease [Desulforhopalus singaporensis]|uniref:TRAP transporter, DctM subunit n=1 Tax=Desulforhopalus singaporensis TaxID=91360 RepID=A0A1H0SLK3_9BACT|nr:TRAP transporter large permease subunit [Desulforhopalus singaporensis]SDP42613.1 TRAP transporter, DctM subunit [Desulforhopalus singaporensis]
MSIEFLTIFLFVAILAVFATGMPVAFGLGTVAMLFGTFTWGPQSYNIIAHTSFKAVSGFVLLAVPLFIFMGQILSHSGIGEKMFHAMHVLAGRVKGGLAIGVIIVCSLMAAMVGIIGAGIMTAGSVALKPMLERGYNKYLALGAIMAGGGMGILIPPSVPMILFSSVTNTSIGKMFAGGIIPGIIMISLFIIYIAIRCHINPDHGPALKKAEVADWQQKRMAIKNSFLAFALIFLVLGSILFGVATPTEAAAVGAVGASVIAMLQKRFTFAVLKDASIQGMVLTGVCVWILIGASIFSDFHMLMGAGKLLTGIMADLNLGPWGVIIFMQLTMMIMGTIMDEWIIVLICAPLYTPIAVSLGFDPVWFGILMILNMEIAIQTPPYGFALFYLKGIAPADITMMDLYKSIGPFLTIKVIVLILCMAIPELITWLPNKLFG